MTLFELSGLITVMGAALAALFANGHSGVLSRAAGFFGGGVFGLVFFLTVLALTAGPLARTQLPADQTAPGTCWQRFLAAATLLSVPATPVLAIIASSLVTRKLLSLAG